MKYIVKATIDRWEVGADVTGKYPLDVADRLVDEGFLEIEDEEIPFVPEPVKRKATRKTIEHFVDDEPAED